MDTKRARETYLKKLIGEYNAAGWLAYQYPRKRLIALNGFPAISEAAAIQRMREALNK